MVRDDYVSPIPDEHSIEDDELAVLGTIISSVPLVGSMGEKLLNRLITPPLERRRDEWFNDLAKRLNQLSRRVGGIHKEVLQSDAFVDAVVQAATAAVKTGDREKREALRNAVLNSALPYAPGEVQQALFLSVVDQFTSVHLRLLTGLQRLASAGTTSGIDIQDLYASVVPDEAERGRILPAVLTDLEIRGLLHVSGWGVEGPGHNVYSGPSEMGTEFLRYISEPPQLRD